ncbi:glutamine--tRNA ligase [Tepidimonas ignava]|uniref:glutamine--tRNA ligase n=1 Tax=Tepidimonas ignava TaxID=114249 RepID=UPI002FD986C1
MSEHAPHTPEHHPASSSNFLRQIIERDLAAGRHQGRHWGGSPGDADHHARGVPDPARIRTRFPPEPNGYLHIGHAKSIWINFSLAQEYGGVCHLRYDDTNPEKEEQAYVDAIADAVQWLGWSWHAHGTEHRYFASDYFETMARAAEYLIETGHAYVDEQTPEQMRANRGTLTEPGIDSPWRDRPVQDNLRRWREMLAGQHPDGAMVLRAKIDMASPNINLRDPTIYRIKHATHHNTGDRWCVYPMYTFAHPIEDALEQITHSICTLEFEDQRPFYDWLLERLVPLLRAPHFARARQRIEDLRAQGVEAAKTFALRCHNAAAKLGRNTDAERRMAALFARWEHDRDAVLRDLDGFFELLLAELHHFTPLLAQVLTAYEPEPFDLPHQYEFARLNLTYVVTSKRKLKALVDEGIVTGWDDPRLPTIAGLRRRGYTPEAIRLFCERTGVSKAGGWIDYGNLEVALRDDLEGQAPRAMAVLDPVELELTNWAEVFGSATHREACRAPLHPHHPGWGERQFTLGQRLWIEREDFAEQPPKGYFRLFPGNKVRLKYGYVVECTGCEKDAQGQVTKVLARVIPDTKSGTPGADAIKVKGTITWVGVHEAVAAQVRLYDRLFTDPQPDAGGKDFRAVLNPASLRTVRGYVEPTLANLPAESRWQFERHGYFCTDRLDHRPEQPVFNRIATLKDGWGGR